MSKIDELIAELCPDGVSNLKLGEVVRIRNGRDYKQLEEGNIPVYGSGGVMKYVNESFYQEPSVLIPRKGSLGNLFFVDLPFWTVDTIFYTEVGDTLEPKYLFYFLKTQDLASMNLAGGVPSLTQTMLNKVKIPVPPLRVQREIVEILDKFTQLEAELEAELEVRKAQYVHTREQLLDFSADLKAHPTGELIAELCPDGVPSRPLGSLLSRRKGIPVTAASMKTLPPGDGSVRIFAGGKTFVDVDSLAVESYSLSSGPAIIVKSRGIIEFAFWAGDFSHKNELWSYIPASPDLEIKFAYHYLRGKTDDFIRLAKSKSVKMPQLSVADTDDFMIPVPPIQVQRKIIEILDKFDALLNDISVGLPAEIVSRRKQYEYYRDKLLTFKELDAE